MTVGRTRVHQGGERLCGGGNVIPYKNQKLVVDMPSGIVLNLYNTWNQRMAKAKSKLERMHQSAAGIRLESGTYVDAAHQRKTSQKAIST